MPEDLLIKVNERDEPIGVETRAVCHSGVGVLHRAFSIYIFDSSQRLLLQRRSGRKQLWPRHWSNSCCSHPRWGEDIDAAADRRLAEELGIRTTLRQIFKFQYQAQFGDYGAEHELCAVYVGSADAVGAVDPVEVEDWHYIEAGDLDRRLASDPETYTPWLRLAWTQLRHRHWRQIADLTGAAI